MAVRHAPLEERQERVGSLRGLPADRRGPAIAVATLVLLPVLVYAIPAALGHPVVPGDDATQNLPLRILVGQDLREGHLPVFDPYIWSGAPLLGGWNAGAAYPLTWVFAFLPATAAWALNLVAAGAVAGVGCYALLRASGLGVLAGWLGAVTFAFGGAMTAQVSHLGLIVGMSWVPLALLAVLRLSDPGAAGASIAHRLAWTAVLAVSVGLIVLAGEPRAIANAAAAIGVYALWRLARLGRLAGLPRLAPAGRATATGRRPGSASPGPVIGRSVVAASTVAVVAGAALGVGLGAVQLLPGLAAVATSQRAQVTSTLFSSGSLPVRWLLLLGVPDLLGGSGSWGQPTFLANYSLTEVSAYMGVLPLVAAGGLLARLRRPLPEWVVWYAVGAVGILLALGNNTPLWHLLVRVPLFGGQRLQSRSIMVTDLALAILLAHWVDPWLDRRRAGARSRRASTAWRREALFASVPALCVCAVVVAALVWESGLLRWMGVAAATASSHGALRPWLVPWLVLGLGAVVLVWGGTLLERRWRAVAVTAFVLLDLTTYAALAVVAVGAPDAVVPAPATAARARSDSVRPIASLGLHGRFAVYDPTLLHEGQLAALGVPDTNVNVGTYAVQGYSSLADGTYARATGTHKVSGTGQDTFSPDAADDGVLDQLDTTAVLVPSAYLATRPGDGGPAAGDGTGRRAVAPDQKAVWYLGTPVDVSSVTLTVAPGGGRPPDGLRLGLVTPSGATTWLPAPAAGGGPGGWTAQPTHPEAAVGVVAEAEGTTAPVTLRAPTVVGAGGGREIADGQLASALTAPHWVYDGRDGPFAVYRDAEAARPLSLVSLPGRRLGGASIRRLSGSALNPTSAAVSSPHGAGVVRSVAAIPGWSAVWQPNGGGAPVSLGVRRRGVVQVVDVPAGTGIVTWRYQAPELTAGELTSLASLAALAVLVVAAAGARRRRRTSAPRVQ